MLAAAKQDREADMILAIQEAYYLRAMNPSDSETLVTLAGELSLDSGRFKTDLRSPDTETDLQHQVAFARRSPISGFPALALRSGDRLTAVRLNYKDYTETLEHLLNIMRPQYPVT